MPVAEDKGDFIHNEAMDEIVCSCDWDQCGVLLTSREELIRHFGQHHDPQLLGQADRVKDVETGKLDRIWSCRWGNCSKTCNRLENLRCHIRTHTGDKPFACSFEGCTKAFTNASDRTKHENRTHLGLKSFPCSLDGCQKCYTDQSSLRKHIKHSHGEHEFELCKKVRKRMKPMPSESLTQDRQSPQTATLPVTAPPFTPDQINALKMVADSLLAGIAAFPHLRNQVPTVLKAESVSSSNYAFTVPTLTNPTTAFEVVDHEKTSRVPAAMLNPADISLFAEEATVKQGPTAKPLPFFDDPEKMKQYRDPETNNMLDDYLLQLSLDQTPSACTLFEEEYEEDV